MDLDIDNLRHGWLAKYPNCEPRAEALKDDFKDRWVRFHSLPNSKRYPETEAEYETVLNRYYTLLKELNPGRSLIVITSEWTGTPDTSPQRWPKRAEVDPDSVHWQTIPEDSDEEDLEYKSYRQVYASRHPWRLGGIDKLLRAVANDEMAGVILAPEDLRWLYHPYDGGADVILPTEAERDELKKRHSDWLSDHPEGL